MSGPVRSVSQAFAVLRVLSGQESAQTLTDVSRATGSSPSSCLNLLRTLVAEGAVAADGKRYRLTDGWQGIAALGESDEERLVRSFDAPMADFARRHDATLGLWRSDRTDRLTLVTLAESPSPTRIALAIGQRQPIGLGSTGRALAASRGLNGAALEAIYQPLRWLRPLDFASFAQQIAKARDKGFAVDDGYALSGVSSAACMIGAAMPNFCLSASTFAGIRSPAQIDDLGRALVSLCTATMRSTRNP